jgi:polyisoprenoid-binding protein YceI
MITRIGVTALAFLLITTSAWAQTAAPGKITITGKQMGAPVEGEFKKFTHKIQLDPANPATGRAVIEIEVASVDIGLEDFNQELRSKTWFDAKSHPKATFTSNAIRPAGAGKLDVSGKLTIKGKGQEVSVPVTVKNEGTTRILEGTLPIKRSAFNIGEGDWKDTSIVADDVLVRFRLVVPAK